MACNKRNTQYSTHFPRLEGGTCGSGNRTGNILGKLDAQRIIFNLSLFSFAVFFCFSLFTLPLFPPLCTMILLHVARSPPSHSHSLCMSFAWQKSNKKWAKWAASWRLGRINTKTKATTSDETIRYPLGNGQLTGQGKYAKPSSNQNLFLVCWTNLIQFASINICNSPREIVLKITTTTSASYSPRCTVSTNSAHAP